MFEVTSKQEAEKRISALTKQAYDNLQEASGLADKWGVQFSFNPAYGMGGTYYPQHTDDSVWSASDDSWAPSDTNDGWYSSSQSC